MNLRKKFFSQLTVVAMLVVFIAFTLFNSFFVQISKTNQYKKEIAVLNKEIQETESQIKNLKSIKSDALSGDLESIARKKLNMVKSNEIVFIDMSREGN